MKIALFHEVVSGGARRGANEFAKSLRSMGHTVDLYIVDQKENESEKSFYDHIYFYTFIPKKWQGGNWRIKLYKDTVEIYHLYQLHKKIALDIESKHYDFAFIHPSQYTQAPLLLRLLTIPKLYYCQEPLRMIYEKDMDQTGSLGFFKKRYERMTRKVRKVVDKKNISRADVIFANSTFTKKNIKQAYGLDSIVCHMGVDNRRFYETHSASSGQAKRDIDILYIGSEDPIDGYALFQKSLLYLKSKAKIEYLLRGKKWLTNDTELADYYSRAKLVICFGKREPFGLISLEAMSCGAVVVALDEGGYKDSVQNEKTGFLVPEDPKIIAKTIDDALQNTILLGKMSEIAKKEMLHHWQWSQSAENVLYQYEVWEKNH